MDCPDAPSEVEDIFTQLLGEPQHTASTASQVSCLSQVKASKLDWLDVGQGVWGPSTLAPQLDAWRVLLSSELLVRLVEALLQGSITAWLPPLAGPASLPYTGPQQHSLARFSPRVSFPGAPIHAPYNDYNDP